MNDNEQIPAHCFKNAYDVLAKEKVYPIYFLFLSFISKLFLYQFVAVFLLEMPLVRMLQRDDHISFFMSLFDIPVGLGDLFKGISPIDDCLDLSHFNKLFEEN